MKPGTIFRRRARLRNSRRLESLNQQHMQEATLAADANPKAQGEEVLYSSEVLWRIVTEFSAKVKNCKTCSNQGDSYQHFWCFSNYFGCHIIPEDPRSKPSLRKIVYTWLRECRSRSFQVVAGILSKLNQSISRYSSSTENLCDTVQSASSTYN
uniref:(northern house mosquito) hypothetical protein n=1 Tax=Culex pipiens TaxID=7175 RepID=A0A8D8C5Y6_CULPI